MDVDQPIEEICSLLKSLLKDDTNQILFCTGRVEDYREKTIEQINQIFKMKPEEIMKATQFATIECEKNK